MRDVRDSVETTGEVPDEKGDPLADRVRVRPMTEADLDRVIEIEVRSFSVPWKRRTFRSLLDRTDAELWVVEHVPDLPPPEAPTDAGEREAAASDEGGVPSSGGIEAASSDEGEPASDPGSVAPSADEGRASSVVAYLVLWFAADEAELADVAVAREHRGRGLGALLVGRAIERARARGAGSLFLEVRASNERALALYRSRGFRVISVRKGYYTRPPEDALVMLRSLW